MSNRYKIIQFTVLLLITSLCTQDVFSAPANQSGSVGIDAYVPCTITLNARPEKRVLSPNPNAKQANPNRQTNLRVQIYDGDEKITEYQGTSNSEGAVSFDPCDPEYEYPANALGNKSYTVFVKGLSHLRSSYSKTLSNSNFTIAINLINDNSDSTLASRTALYNSFNSIVDYEAYSQDLYAGEVSAIFDNMINSLDFSVMSRVYGSNENKIDLNQDNIVNSLDFSILSTNYWKGGAVLPGGGWTTAAQNFFSARQNVISNQ